MVRMYDRLHTRIMKILYAAPGYKPAYKHGGPIVAVAAVAERLVRNGHEVRVFTTNSNVDEDLDVPTNQPIQVNGVEVWYFRRTEFLKRYFGYFPYLTGAAGFHYAPEMAANLKAILPQTDIVHTLMPFVYPTYVASRIARKLKVPVVYKGFGSLDPQRLRFRAAKKRLYIRVIERQIMRRADMLIALTEAEVESYRALGITTPCRTVPDGIDVEDYREKANSPLPPEWNVPRDAKVILFLGRLWTMKGPDKLIEAFAQIHLRFPDALLIIAGPNEHGLEDSLRILAAKCGVAEKVRFPGMITGETKLDLLARADLFCLPSDAEGFSIAVLEALASGTAVMLSPGCYFPEVAGAAAGKIAACDPKVMAETMAQMLSNPESLRAMGRAGRQLVSQNYTWEPITARLEHVYREVLQKNKRT